MQIEKHVRDLAKSYKYQTISNGGENPINCFVNKFDFTFYQLFFMSYLRFYHTLNMDVAEEEVDEIVLTDTVYEDAYMYWRGKNKYKKMKQDIDKNYKSNRNPKAPIVEKQELKGFKWDFKSK